MMGFVIQEILRSEANPVEPSSCPGKPPGPTTTHGVFQPPFFFSRCYVHFRYFEGGGKFYMHTKSPTNPKKKRKNTMVVLCVFLCDISSPRAEKKNKRWHRRIGCLFLFALLATSMRWKLPSAERGADIRPVGIPSQRERAMRAVGVAKFRKGGKLPSRGFQTNLSLAYFLPIFGQLS